MKRGVIIFWSLFIGCAVIRILFSLHQNILDIGECSKQLVIGTGMVMQEPERKEEGQVLLVSVNELFIATTTKGEVARVVMGACSSNVLIRMKTKLYPRFIYGDQISFSGKISKPFNFRNETGREFDYIGYLAKDDVFYEIKSAKVEYNRDFASSTDTSEEQNRVSAMLFYLKRGFVSNLEKVLGEPHAALAAGLVVGEKSALGADLLEDFRVVGLIHIVVLSGFNITIVGDAIRRMLSFLPRVWGIVLGGIGIGLFGVMVGGGATVVRSCFMAGVALSADLIRRDYQVLRALIFAGLIMIIQNPMILLHDPSFQLSFMATLGLIILASPIEKKLAFITEKFGLRGIVAATVSTQIFISPFILHMMGQISIIGLVVNILVLPIIPVTMLFVFLTGASGFISLSVAHAFGWITHWLLTYELLVVKWFAEIPFASVTLPEFSIWWVVGFYVGFAVIFWYLKKGKKKVTNRQDFRKIFEEFQKIPKGILVDNPSELISVDLTITKPVSQIIGADILHAFFTRRTLKHIAEKGSEGKRLITLIPCILSSPDILFKGKCNRFICVKYFSNVERELQVVVIEFVNNTAIIVTSFVSDEKYLKNFEILWRTGTSLS